MEGYEEKNGKTILNGRAGNNKIIHFEGKIEQVGSFVNVKTETAKTWYLTGKQI